MSSKMSSILKDNIIPALLWLTCMGSINNAHALRGKIHNVSLRSKTEIHKCEGDRLRTAGQVNLELLTNMTKVLEDAPVLTQLGGEAGLKAIFEKNAWARLSTYPTPHAYLKTIDQYVDDVYAFAKEFGPPTQVDGFNDVLSTLKSSNTWAVESGAQMLKEFSANPTVYKKSTVFSIDGSFKNNFANDVDDFSCTNCRFDVLMSSGKKIELKSYKLETINGIAGGNLKAQHRNYLEAPGALEYIFEKGKLPNSLSIQVIENGIIKTIGVSPEQYIRHQFLEMYKNAPSGYFLTNNAISNFWSKFGANLNDPERIIQFINDSKYSDSWLNFIVVK